MGNGSSGNAMLNRVSLIGFVVGDSKSTTIKTKDNKKLKAMSFYVSVPRESKNQEYDIIKCKCYGMLAINLALNLNKGRKICLDGRLTVNRNTGYGNVPTLDIFILVQTVYFLDEGNPTISFLKAKEEQKKAIKKKLDKVQADKPNVAKNTVKKSENTRSILDDLDEDKVFDF